MAANASTPSNTLPEPDADAVGAWRTETPGCNAAPAAEKPLRIHLNAAGAAFVPRPVHDAVVSHLELERSIGGYEAAAKQAKALQAVYLSAARLINAASPDEIALVESATVAWASAFYSLSLQPGDIVLTSPVEYGANYVAFLHAMRTKRIRVHLLPVSRTGEVDAAQVADAIAACNGRCRLVAVTHIPTNGGVINPCPAIGAAIHAWNSRHNATGNERVLFLVDACQTVGQMPVDVQSWHVDLLSATSRKYLRGPRGCGFLYARLELLQTMHPPTIDHYAAGWVAKDAYKLHPTARRFEKWESSPALHLGLGAAIDYALAIGPARIWRRVQWLAGYLRSRMQSELAGRVTLHDLGALQCGIVTFTAVKGGHGRWLPSELKDALQKQFSISSTVSTIGATRIDMEQRGLDSVNRASVHYYNTTEEVDALIRALDQLTKHSARARL